MARPPVTVAVLVGTDRQGTRSFLALLAPTLGPRDDVVLLGGGHRPEQPGSWRVRRAGKLTRAAERPPTRDVVVVVDERTVPTGPWLDPLVTAVGEPRVGAAAARTNMAAGDELLVGVPYRPHETAAHRSFVRRRATEHRDLVSVVEHLGGPSLAVARSTLELAGGLEALLGGAPVQHLVRHAAAGGHLLVVAEGAYLHHAGGAAPRPLESAAGPRPFVSACLITKDERHNLPRCLASIDGFADEIVVYDTGSTDGTPELARALGATVLDGYWDDDFSRARNESLARCTGEWVLWLDADEALVCADPGGSRRALAELSSDDEALVVLIDNLRGTQASTTFTHPGCRLFRRAYGMWTGRLHEQVTARAGSARLTVHLTEGIRITHWGYLAASIGGRDKGRRNIRSAFGDLTGDADLTWATRLVSLGRSYNLAGRPEEGLALCRAAAAAADAPGTRRLALRSVVDALMALDRAEDALVEIARLRSVSTAHMLADTEEGRALLHLGRDEEALAAFARVTDGLDDDGYEHRVHDLAAERALALTHLERHDEAADVLLAGLRGAGGMDAHVGMLLECLEQANRPLAELAEAVPQDRAVAFLGQLVHLDAELADRALEAWHAARPSRAVLATASWIAPGLSAQRRRAWSERLRADGLGHACPLVLTVADTTRPLVDRLAGAATAWVAFGDGRGHQAFAALALQLPLADREAARDELAAHAPSTVAAFDELCEVCHQGEGSAVDETSGPTATPAPAPSTACLRRATAPARSVLVVDRKVAALRTMAVARLLCRSGHRVTVAHPQPAAQTEELLAPAGARVRGWTEQHGPAGWHADLVSHVALLYADEPYDTVVVAADAAETLPALRRLLPAARLVIDAGHDPGADLAEVAHLADLVLVAPAGTGVTGGTCEAAAVPVAVTVAASASTLFAATPGLPEPARVGVCVVGDFRTATVDELGRWEAVAQDLGRRTPQVPVAVVGDDPGGCAAAALPDAVTIGPVADPRPWLAAARLVLVAGRGAEHWLSIAARCGTPALVVPEDASLLGQVAPAVVALADPSQQDLWHRFAPVVPTPGPPDAAGTGTATGLPHGPATDDPLAALPAPPTTGVGGSPTSRRGAPPDVRPVGGRPIVARLEWPYGGVPAEWVGALRDVAREVVVPSAWGRRHAIASGLPAGAVRVAELAVDTECFAPHGERRPLPTGRATTLLFSGTAGAAGGLDALLEAYLTAFTADDDVGLVVHLADEPGADRGWSDEVHSAARPGGGRPEIVMVDGTLAAEERAALYRACDVLVAAYRGTASLRTVVEAMASGLPVLGSAVGPLRDVCDERTGWLVDAREVAADDAELASLADLGGWGSGLGLTPTTHGIWQTEPDRAALGAALRHAVEDPEERLLKGLAARDRAATRWSNALVGRACEAADDRPTTEEPLCESA